MADPFETLTPGLEAPGSYVTPVTPDDNTDLATVSRALYVGTGGNIALTLVGGSTATFTNVQDGAVLPLRVSRVLNAGTSASDILALW